MLKITITKADQVLTTGSNTAGYFDMAGQYEQSTNVALTAAQAANRDAQFTAMGVGTAAFYAPVGPYPYAAVAAGVNALYAQEQVFSSDLSVAEAAFKSGTLNTQQELNLAGEVITMAGDTALIVGGVANALPPTPITKALALGSDLAGDAATLSGIAIEKYADSLGTNFAATAMENLADYEFGSIESFLAQNNSAASSAFGSNWAAVDTSLTSAFSLTSTTLGDVNNASAFLSNATSTLTALNNSVTPLTNLYYGAGGTVPNFTATSSAGTNAADLLPVYVPG